MIRHKKIKKGLILLTVLMIVSLYLPVFANESIGLRTSNLTDLTNWDFEENGIHPLSGLWEFYPKRVIYHEDFLKGQQLGDKQLVEIPAFFLKNEHSTSETGKDYGTLRTIVKIPANQVGKKLALRSTFYYINIAVFADGQSLTNNNFIIEPGKIKPYKNTKYVTTFIPKSDKVEIIIHYSKKDYSASSYGRITIGLDEQIQEQATRELIVDTLAVGIVIALVTFNLAFFMRHNRRKNTEKLSLYFSMLSVLILIRFIHSGEHYVLYLIPNLPNELFAKLNYWSYYLLMPSFILFANEIRREMINSSVVIMSRYIMVLLGLSVLIANSNVYSKLIPLVILYFIAVLVLMAIQLYQSFKLRIKLPIAELITGLIMSLVFVLDSFYVLGFSEVRIYFTLATLLFMGYISFSVAKVYASSVDQLEDYFIERERLSAEIKTLESSYVRNLTEKQANYEAVLYQKELRLNALEKVADVLEGAMAVLDLELNIIATYGANSKNQFGEHSETKPFLKYFIGENTENGRLFTDILNVVARMTSFERMETYLSLLPKKTNKQGRWYAMTTTVVTDADKKMQNFVVLIKDVTKLVTLQEKVTKSESEASLLKNYGSYRQELQYLSITVSLFIEKEIDSYFESGKDSDTILFDVLGTLERYAVWYKVLGFENTYIQYRKFIKTLEQLDSEDVTPEKSVLIQMIKDSNMSEFDLVDRKFITEYLGENFTFEHSDLKVLLTKRQDFLGRLEIMKRYCSVLAELYGKTIDPLKVEGTHVVMSLEVISVLMTSISRILDSIIVHHIEYYDERAKANKPLTGHIEMEIYKDLEHVFIEIKDDGSGININTLKDSLYRLNLLSFKEIVNASESEILPYIFEKGIYYKEVDNEFYGIGDGLWKVKKSIEGIGGTIAVESGYQSYCKFIIALPLEEIAI